MTNFNFDKGKMSLLDWLFQFWEKLKQHDEEIEDLQEHGGGGGGTGTPAGFGVVDATATTLDAGAKATAEVEADGPDTAKNFHFSFGIPKGETGPAGQDGAPGKQGPQGPAGPGVPTGGTAGQVLAKKSTTDYDTEWVDAGGGGGGTGTPAGFGVVDATATTLDAGAKATAEVEADGPDTAKNFHFSFGIPKGETGPAGQDGAPGKQGPQGPAGPGVPTGGTAGQVLAKKSATDYDTEWIDAGGGGGTGTPTDADLQVEIGGLPAGSTTEVKSVDLGNCYMVSGYAKIMSACTLTGLTVKGSDGLVPKGVTRQIINMAPRGFAVNVSAKTHDTFYDLRPAYYSFGVNYSFADGTSSINISGTSDGYSLSYRLLIPHS